MAIGTLLFFVVLLIAAGLIVVALIRTLNPSIKNKAGPNWMWRFGKFDPVRGIFFKQDGSFRRYSQVGLSVVLGAALILVLSIIVATALALISH